MKFKHDIEAQAGFKDKDGQLGSAGQILSSTGSQTDWIDQSTINAGNAEHVVIYAKNTSGASISKGTPVYITGTVGATDTVEIAPADAGNSAKMPAVGLLDDTLANNAFGYVITGGFMDNITTDPIDGATPSSNDTVYVKSGGGLTLTKPTGTNFIQNVAKVGKVSGGNSGSLIVSSILRTNDVPTPLYVDHANQRLGIGTTSPAYKLDVDGTARIQAATSAALTFEQSGNVYQAAINSSAHLVLQSAANNQVIFKDGGATNMTIDGSTGNVGIGTTSPGAKLQISSGNNVDAQLLVGEGSTYGAPSIRFKTDSINYMGLGFTTGSVLGNEVLDAIAIQRTGNVGIGTTSPNHKLDVDGGAQFNTNTGTTPFYITRLGSTSQALSIKVMDDNVRFESIQDEAADNYGGFDFRMDGGTTEPDFVVRKNAGDPILNVKGNGNVGIGTTSPSHKLHIADGSDSFKYGADIGDGFDGVLLTGGAPGVKFAGPGDDFIIGKITAGVAFFNSTDSSYKMILNDDGNLGIGTTSPGQPLHVNGNARVDGDFFIIESNPQIFLSDTNHNSDFSINLNSGLFKITDTTNSTDRITLDSSGNVGIGTTSPDYKLEIDGTLGVSRTDGIIFAGSAGTGTGSKIVSNTSNDLIFSTALTTSPYTTTERVRILNNGNVGIGTTSPTSLLTLESNSSSPYPGIDIKSTAYYPGSKIRFLNSSGSEVSTIESYNNPGRQDITVRYTGSSTGGKVELQDNAAILAAGTSAAQSYAQVGVTDFRVITNYGTRMYINTLGYVGVNETSPNARLQVKESSITTFTGTGSSAQLRLRGGYTTNEYIILGFSQDSSKDIGRMAVKRGSSGSSFHWGVSTNYGNGITNEAMILNHQGRLGINNLTPSYLLDVGGDGRVNGTLTCVTLVQTSQRDQKKDIADIDKTKAKAIPFKEYKYKSSIDGSERKRYGVVAEDIENDYPELVHTGADGIKGINYIDLLVKRVAELEKELEDISLTPGPKGDKGDTGAQGPAGANGTNGKDGANGNDHLKNVQSIAFNEKTGQLEITIEGHKDPFKFNPAK